jgi:quercetin dioxygenase-like cupin family protein
MKEKDFEIIHRKFEDIEQEVVNEGYLRRTVTGQNQMVCLVEARPEWVTKRHKHGNDETLIMIEGSMSLRVGDRDIELNVGDILYIPPWIEHMGTVREKGMKMIKIFSPPREDYLDGTDSYLREPQGLGTKLQKQG